MRFFPIAFSALALLALPAAVFPARADINPNTIPYPGDVALSQESGGVWVFRQFPTGLRLYVFDEDTEAKENTEAKSACIAGCSFAWPPLRAPVESKPMGDWTKVHRDGDNYDQWAYKGHPVYIRYHDLPDDPVGEKLDKRWHILNP